MKAHITVLAQRRPGHKVFSPAVVSGKERFMHTSQHRKRSLAILKAVSLAGETGIPYKEPGR